MAYASENDVAELLSRELTDEEKVLVERRLDQVERMIIRRVPDLDTKVQLSETFEADLIDIEAEAVMRVIRNPEGLFSEQDGSYGYQLSREAADNRLRILPEEWRVLNVNVGSMMQICPRIGGQA